MVSTKEGNKSNNKNTFSKTEICYRLAILIIEREALLLKQIKATCGCAFTVNHRRRLVSQSLTQICLNCVVFKLLRKWHAKKRYIDLKIDTRAH